MQRFPLADKTASNPQLLHILLVLLAEVSFGCCRGQHLTVMNMLHCASDGKIS